MANAADCPQVTNDPIASTCDLRGTWHAGAGQDRVVAAILEGKRGGFFVDCAANHPIHSSNSRALERDFGWSGVCIEGNEEHYRELLRRRTCAVVGAVVSSHHDEPTILWRTWPGARGCEEGSKKGCYDYHHELSGIVNVYEDSNSSSMFSQDEVKAREIHRGRKPKYDDKNVSTVGLETILRLQRAPREIDYLSLDVQGAEENVLLHFPFESYTFLVMTVELPTPRLVGVLLRNGYVLAPNKTADGRAPVWRGHGDELFVHRSIKGGATAAIERAFAVDGVHGKSMKNEKKKIASG